jgi:hypothetical protein
MAREINQYAVYRLKRDRKETRPFRRQTSLYLQEHDLKVNSDYYRQILLAGFDPPLEPAEIRNLAEKALPADNSGEALEVGDVLLHTLELASPWQLLTDRTMGDRDDKLWCGLEYNYDLFSLVDLRTVKGEFNSLQKYLDKKKSETSYGAVYRDETGNAYLDEYGGIPFVRTETKENLTDRAGLDLNYVNQDAMALLDGYYIGWKNRGITVYASYACMNMDAVPEEERENVQPMDTAVRNAFTSMEGAVLISSLEDFLFENADFYDTNYHLLTTQAKDNTAVWLRDLVAQMTADGIWEVGQ